MYLLGEVGLGVCVMVTDVLGGAKEQLDVHPSAFVVSVAAEYYLSLIVHLFNLVL